MLELLARRGVRFVRVSPGTQLELSPSTFIDNRAAAATMTRHLSGLGHQRIGFIAGDPGFATSAQRTEGYLDALRAAGIAVETDLIRSGNYDFASGAREAEALLALPKPPTAIFAASDDMAAGVLTVAHRVGLSVPGELSVAGFDDTALARYVWPPLTTIRQPTREMAHAAADLLLTEAGDMPERREIAHALVVRESTGGVGRGIATSHAASPR